ncbi:MAG TPA: hypothetical protein VMW94_09080 [Actinomycetes bacterium]|nr:hypothetical protein [Actinomycetes bacterium]
MLTGSDLARVYTEQRVRQAQMEGQARRLLGARRARRRAERAACRARDAAEQAAYVDMLL